MNADRRRAARARLALRTVARQHLFDPHKQVTLIDYGIPLRSSGASDDPTLRFHVQQKHSPLQLESLGMPTIPRQIGEFTTDVIEGRYTPHLAPARSVHLPATSRHNPLLGGISISDTSHITAGTLGCLVRDRASGDAMLLSNWHVLVINWLARLGKPICQPGRLDGGTVRDTIATLTRHAMRANLDAAVATLTGSRAPSDLQRGLGMLTGVAQPELGMQVIKSGRTTGISRAIVTGVDGEARISYGRIVRTILHVVTLGPLGRAEVSAAGDSGSCWMEQATNRAIGLHFAGSNDPETGLALDMQTVLDTLQVDLLLSQSTHVPRVRQQEQEVFV